MGWLCDFCSSFNSDETTECFVCGQRRSEASLRAAREHAREERHIKLDQAIWRKSYKTSRIIFLIGLGGSSVVLILALIMIIINKQYNVIAESLTMIAKTMWYNIAELFTVNIGLVFFPAIRGIANDISLNIKEMTGVWLYNSSTLLPIFSNGVFPDAKNKILFSYTYRIQSLMSSVEMNLCNLASTVSFLANNIAANVALMFSIIATQWRNIISNRS